MNNIDPRPILRHFYPEESPLRRLLLTHSTQVRDKALELADTPAGRAMNLDLALVETGAMLHDIGIVHCHAPKILCNGPEPYLAHGIIGANMLRSMKSTSNHLPASANATPAAASPPKKCAKSSCQSRSGISCPKPRRKSSSASPTNSTPNPATCRKNPFRASAVRSKNSAPAPSPGSTPCAASSI